MCWRNPQKTLCSDRTEDSFVDDCSAGVDGRDEKEVERLQQVAQKHEKLLHATGGALSLDKSHWVHIRWIWKNGRPTLDKAGAIYDGAQVLRDQGVTHQLTLTHLLGLQYDQS